LGNYLKEYLKNRRQGTPQGEPIPGMDQVPNSAGGYAFAVDAWVRLDRFLVLGSEGGSYYASERKLTVENAAIVIQCIGIDGVRVVQQIIGISVAGRAPKQDPAILALALCFAYGDEETRRVASDALPLVCRTGTHLLHFAAFVTALRGWGRGLRRAVGRWYTAPQAGDVAFQVAKYPSRDGWAHRDLLRLAHPVPPDEAHSLIFQWVTEGWPGVGPDPHPIPALQLIWALEKARTAEKAELLRLIADYRLPREAIPTQWLNDPDVWAALLPNLGLTAILRNLGNLSKCGLLIDSNRDAIDAVAKQLTDADALKRARIHPLAVLTALITYKGGRGMRGGGVWPVSARVVDALDTAFYKAFGAVQPSNTRTLLALDVSGSMGMGTVAGVIGLTPRIASAAMALVTAATEPGHSIVGFSHDLVNLPISPRQRLDDVVRILQETPMGATDCALPMTWALEHRQPYDTFIVYTDSETWFGNIHPVEALRAYREMMGIPARLIVVGMVANGFSIADPNDGGMLDVVGFDTAAPQVIADFARGR
jgi:60 kDa SS-A/Ro ribonucleoprotein